MSFLGTRNAVSIGVSQHVTMGGPNLLNKLSPSLLLNFAGAQTLDPRITFTRATTATFTGSNGLIQTAAINAPRFDYDPTTLAPLGLLIEEQRVNLLLYSEEFDNAYWTKTRASITANVTTAPDGTSNADKLVEDTTATATHQISRSISYTSGTIYTRSLYAKAVERTGFRFQFPSTAFTSGLNAYFDLANGTIVGTPSSPATATITPVGDGWYRCTMTATATATVSATEISCGLTISGNNPTYTGDGTSGIYIWGAQLEAGAFATSYIPTVASQVTRSADAASMTGTNFSSWYNASEGTFFSSVVLAQSPALKSSACIYAASDNTVSNRILVLCGTGSGGNINALVTTGGVAQAQTINGGLSTAGAYLYANAYKVNDFASVVNGGAAVTDISGTVPVVDRLYFGALANGSPNLNSHISRIAYFPRRLANAELQSITA